MIIQLDDLPDCGSCPEPTKRISGRATDLEGPGVRSPVYSCGNKACKRGVAARISYLIRRELYDERRNGHEKRKRTD